MTKKQISIDISETGEKKLAALTQKYGTQAAAIELALDCLYAKITPGQLSYKEFAEFMQAFDNGTEVYLDAMLERGLSLEVLTKIWEDAGGEADQITDLLPILNICEVCAQAGITRIATTTRPEPRRGLMGCVPHTYPSGVPLCAECAEQWDAVEQVTFVTSHI